MNPKNTFTRKNAHILYDADLLDHVDDDFFEPDAWRAKDTLIGSAVGRGTTFFVRQGDREWVVRHFRRGGLVARLLGDHYPWLGLSRTRAWREWQLLKLLVEKGLPVPAPVATRVVRQGLFYTADLVTALIKARSLSELASYGRLDSRLWHDVGACIRRFHEAGVYHADLNAHNVLVREEDGAVHLIDFDRGAMRHGGRWKQRNLARLHRSLSKLATQRPGFVFGEREWAVLLEGYGS